MEVICYTMVLIWAMFVATANKATFVVKNTS